MSNENQDPYVELGENNIGGKRYAIPGAAEWGLPLAIVAVLQPGDSIVDNHGRGRTVYISNCCVCGRLLISNLLILVAQYCGEVACQRAKGFDRYLEES